MEINNKKTNILNLLKKINVEPKNLHLYLSAFVHNSYAYEQHLDYNYQKLEFLGDSIIMFTVAKWLYLQHEHDWTVGQISKTRSLIVQSKATARVAKEIGIDQCILVSKGFTKNTNLDLTKFLEDCYEALIGAIYLDHGIDIAERVINETLLKNITSESLENFTDYKTIFQELMMQYGKNEIRYKLAKNEHNNFCVELWCNNICYGKGTGTKIRDAEKLAAKEGVTKFIGKKVNR